MKKNYTFVLLLSVMTMFAANVMAAWDGTSAAWTNGDGTENNPFLIENEQQFAYFSEQVNGGNTFENQFVKLTTDLDLGASDGKQFTMIGKLDKYFDSDTYQNVDASKYFKGNFDGGFHTIDNASITYIADSENSSIGGTGLFACTTTTTVIKNLTLGANTTITGAQSTGGFVGQMSGGLVTNCCNKGTVKTTEELCTGGIVGVMEGGSVTYCANKGSVYGTTEVGGIVGQGLGGSNVSFCYNTGSVTASGYGGAGIAGALYKDYDDDYNPIFFVIENCYSAGTISGQSSKYMGEPHAIVSDAAGNTVQNCYYVKVNDIADENATEKTAEEMASQTVIDALNNDVTPAAFVTDSKSLNNGLPALSWEISGETTAIRNVEGNVNSVAFSVNGNQVVSDGVVSVYDMSGRQVATGSKVVLSKGAYIIKAGKQSRKYVIK